jgi:hypothetical protein
MSKSVARITFLGSNLYLIEQLTRPTDPGYGQGGSGNYPGNRPPGSWGGRPDQDLPGFGHPDQGLPGFGHPDQGLPGYGHPDQGLPGMGGNYPSQGLPGSGGRPDQGLPVPPPEGVATPPINLPQRPQLPPGSGVVVPLPEGIALPTPQDGEQAPAPGTKPYVLWFGPGTQSSVVHLKPSSGSAQPK